MLLASSKSIVTYLCFACTLFLYTHVHFTTPPEDSSAASSTTSEKAIFDPKPNAKQIANSSNNVSAPADIVPESPDRTSSVSGNNRPRILQATMMFGDKYNGLNERTLQSHVDHAKRWGYGDHTLRREIVGAGQWDKLIFSKVLHILNLIMEELKRPREERAEWVVWYDADTLILNPNIQWEIFLPPDDLSDISFMATKNLDGFNAGLFFFRVNEWSVELLSDSYSLRRLRPEIDIRGNIEQNSMKYLFGLEQHKKHILYQPQNWYNGMKGYPRSETEINEGDLLVHFAGINHDGEEEMKNDIMAKWFADLEQNPGKWQVPLEKTKYPRAIEAFWKTYKEAKDMLDSVHVRPDSQSGPDQEVKHAREELNWAIEELAYDGAHVKKCMKGMAEALSAAKAPQVVAGSGGHANQEPSGRSKELSSDVQTQLASSIDSKTTIPEKPRRFKAPPAK